jgi:hypothetical protein
MSLRQEVRRTADAKAEELGFDPKDCAPELLERLRPDDETFLEDQGISDWDGLWAVYYSPPSVFVDQGVTYGVCGGDLTVYVDVRSLNVVAVWQGE